MKNDNDLSKLELLVNNIRDNLVSSIEGASFPSNTRIPFRTYALRESLLHRIADLGSTAYKLFNEQNALSGIIITRSMLETVAILYLLKYKIEKTIESNDLDLFSKYLARLTTGSKNKTSDEDAINVLSAIDSWTKQESKIEKLYEDLSEFSHPNYWSTLALMGKADRKNYKVNFGREYGKWQIPLRMGVSAALIVIQSSEYIYNEMADILPKFFDLCEQENK